MSTIRPIQSIDTYTYPTNSAQDTTGAAFEQVLQQETIVYAETADDTTFMNPQGSLTVTPATIVSGTATVFPDSSATTPSELEPIFDKAARQYGISKDLLMAVAKAESNYNPSAVSGAGAIGIMQLMPDTANNLGVSNPYDATENIMGGARYLSQLLTQYNGDASLALAAYNAGSGNVDKWIKIPPFKETQNYVSKVLADAGMTPAPSSTAATIYAVAAASTTSTL